MTNLIREMSTYCVLCGVNCFGYRQMCNQTARQAGTSRRLPTSGQARLQVPLTSARLHLASRQNIFAFVFGRTERDFPHFFCKYLLAGDLVKCLSKTHKTGSISQGHGPGRMALCSLPSPVPSDACASNPPLLLVMVGCLVLRTRTSAPPERLFICDAAEAVQQARDDMSSGQ